MTIQILGSEWTVLFETEEENPRLTDSDGYSDPTNRTISIKKKYADELMNLADLDTYKRKVLRHEVVHAFLYESGLTSIARDETVVEWIAVQISRLNAAMMQAGCV